MICSKGIPKFSKIAFLTGKITQSSIMMESKIEKIIVLLFSLITRELISIGSKTPLESSYLLYPAI